MEKSKIKRELMDFIIIVVGSAIMAIGINYFLLPNKLSTGGFSRNSDINLLFI